MGSPYSLDLRERVVAAVAGGMSRAEAARHFRVSHSSAIRWTKRQAETGSPAALPVGGKKPFALARISQCASTARFTSGGRIHPGSCR